MKKKWQNAPEEFETKKAIGKGFEGLQYRMQVIPWTVQDVETVQIYVQLKKKL